MACSCSHTHSRICLESYQVTMHRWLIIYFIIFTNLILLSGLSLYFLEENSLTRSIEGSIEIITPHIFSILLLIFIAGHLLLFDEKRDKRKTLFLSLVVMLLSLLINFAQFFDIGFLYALLLFIFFTNFSLLLYFLTISL